MNFAHVETLSYSTVVCAACGVHFALTSDFETERRKDGRLFTCPNGHELSFNSELKRLQEVILRKEAELRAAKCDTLREQQLREQAERKLKRVERGVCPHCNRSFCNLARHMKNKHP